ncbi:CvpA family protein [Butyrivibrio sp. VCB2006]|uniref:CvpA family protein n=1 Tax=Butyrivibrio sp. VCB2006 TaxID=1280679 RepID=UPI00041315F6|nr:CvpA family protein [Butyrivibrio sp. VCB2006]
MAGFDISQIIMTVVVVCLILWRMSYGINNGLFAEAAGLIAVIASFIAVYYSINIVNNVIKVNLGDVIPKIGYLLVAFLVYKIMISISEAFRKIKNIPIIGTVDRFLGAILGIAEAVLIIALIEYATNIEIVTPVLSTCYQLVLLIQKSFINK